MWESIKNKFRRNKHIEEEQKIETENLQNEEVTNSEAEASLQSGETNANSDMESSLQSEKNIHSETESLQSGEVTQDDDKAYGTVTNTADECNSSADENVSNKAAENLSHDEAAKASNENNGSDNEAISSENNIPDNENVSNEAADNSQNVDDGEIKTAECWQVGFPLLKQGIGQGLLLNGNGWRYGTGEWFFFQLVGSCFQMQFIQ